MFKDNTVFIIGAGASAEFGLPVGSSLTQTIKNDSGIKLDEFGRFLQGSKDIFRHYENTYDTNDYEQLNQFQIRLNASRQIANGIESAESIDEYIFRYSSDPIIAEVGKIHIAHAISLAESKSILSDDAGFSGNVQKADHTWIWSFAKALMTGVKVEDVETLGRNITIICFNYDRCIQHYLEHAFVRGFHGLSQEKARKIVSGINIIHPYGWLGDLNGFPFGRTERFAPMSQNLITWSETISDPEILPKIHAAIGAANQLVFMGFGFAAQNMDLLNCHRDYMPVNQPRVYATGLNLPKETNEVLQSKIVALYTDSSWRDTESEKIHFQYGAKCRDFLDIHRLNLVS